MMTTAETSFKGFPITAWLCVYQSMVVARNIDEQTAALVRSGNAAFHASGAGHEGTAILQLFLTPNDWLHPHYRDKALLVARGLSVQSFFNDAISNAESHSSGRQMPPMTSRRSLRILSTVTPVGNNALQAVGIASVAKGRRTGEIVVCAMGDGATQQGEVLEAIGEAARSAVPILFLIEDNGLSISTRTARRTFFSLASIHNPKRFFGIPICRLDGRDVLSCVRPLAKIVAGIRRNRRPVLVVFKVERLSSHSNADDERLYRTAIELETARLRGDPVRNCRHVLVNAHVPEHVLTEIDRCAQERVRQAVASAFETNRPTPMIRTKRSVPTNDVATECNVAPVDACRHERPRTMLEAMRDVIRQHMQQDARIELYGQDIEDPKGDVFGLTKGLTLQFPGRVVNAPLSESTILGVCIGKALAGLRPIAFIQFADFLPLAFNQLISEMATMYWRTAGDWECPVILMAACGGYRPGLGPFHSETFEAFAAHVPGIDVLTPSTAADAAGLLNAALASGRPTLFLYPKACLTNPKLSTHDDVSAAFVPLGKARFVARGRDLTIVAWGNTVELCSQVVDEFACTGVDIDLIDLRSASPWDKDTVCASITRTRRLLVVHEDNRTCGLGAEIAATAVESVSGPITVRRVCRDDTYVPYDFENHLHVLPSFRSVLEAATELLGLELRWQTIAVRRPELVVVEAAGSSPTDNTVMVVDLKVSVGDAVTTDQPVADVEGDKTLVELTSPVDGIVQEIFASAGDRLGINTPLMTIKNDCIVPSQQVSISGHLSRPILKARTRTSLRSNGRLVESTKLPGLSPPSCAIGSHALTNPAILARFPEASDDTIVRRTGIESRAIASACQSAMTLAADATERALAADHISIADIDAIMVSTTTPARIAPSMSCQMLKLLCDTYSIEREVPCMDILAACSGYLYALSAAWDFVQSRSAARVLVITAEHLSTVTDPNDFDTAVLFGDAASATVVSGNGVATRSAARLHRPVVSAAADQDGILSVPLLGCGYITMNGRKVFPEAIQKMSQALRRACEEAGTQIDDLDLVIPHQANGRIIAAMAARLALPRGRVVNQIMHVGNTSSSSIPLCLENLLREQRPGTRIGLCAFGGGFTFGGAILECE